MLDTLAPAERLAFVLHDLFGVPFDEIAPIVGRSPAATRQLASRARRRVQGASRARRRRTSRASGRSSTRSSPRRASGDFDALLAVLDPDVVLRADGRRGRDGRARPRCSARRRWPRRSPAALGRRRPALVDGEPGAVWAPGGQPRVVFGFTIEGGRIVAMELLADPDRLGALTIAP